MKIADAKREIYIIWGQWDHDGDGFDKSSKLFGQYFCTWLEKNRPDLLSFKCSGDKYQRVTGWIAGWQSKN
jgi:hypothetical protein